MERILMIVPEDRYGIKCPNMMSPVGITVHNTANDASAHDEVAYMTRNDMETSFHFAVDDVQAVQGLPLDRNGWHASDGNGPGNRSTIGIEICYSLSGGERFDMAERNAAELIASILIERGWDISAVQTHQHYAPNKKYCPHRTLDNGWDRFLDMIRAFMTVDQPAPAIDAPQEIETPLVEVQEPDLTVQVFAGGRWYDNVHSDDANIDDPINGFAGVYGEAISGVYGDSSVGELVMMAHDRVSGKWYPAVSDRNDYAGILGRDIDMLVMWLENAPGFDIEYAVHTTGGRWLPSVFGRNANKDDYNDGCAGVDDDVTSIDAVMVKVIPR